MTGSGGMGRGEGRVGPQAKAWAPKLKLGPQRTLCYCAYSTYRMSHSDYRWQM